MLNETLNTNFDHLRLQDTQKNIISRYFNNIHKPTVDDINYFILYTLPTQLRYATEVDIINIRCVIDDIVKENMKDIEISKIDDIMNNYFELLRIYKFKDYIFKLINDPVLDNNVNLISLDNYKLKKNKQADMASTYEKSTFEVIAVKDGGSVVLKKLTGGKEYKLLLEYPSYKHVVAGDIIKCTIKRKLFYVYWEIEDIISIYSKESKKYLKEV